MLLVHKQAPVLYDKQMQWALNKIVKHEEDKLDIALMKRTVQQKFGNLNSFPPRGLFQEQVRLTTRVHTVVPVPSGCCSEVVHSHPSCLQMDTAAPTFLKMVGAAFGYTPSQESIGEAVAWANNFNPLQGVHKGPTESKAPTERAPGPRQVVVHGQAVYRPAIQQAAPAALSEDLQAWLGRWRIRSDVSGALDNLGVEEVEDLVDVEDDKIEELCTKYEEEGLAYVAIPKADLWKAVLKSTTETGTPYLPYKDSCNSNSNQKNMGTTNSSSFCTEIIE